MVPFYVFMHGYFFSACPPISEPSSRACQEKFEMCQCHSPDISNALSDRKYGRMRLVKDLQVNFVTIFSYFAISSFTFMFTCERCFEPANYEQRRVSIRFHCDWDRLRHFLPEQEMQSFLMQINVVICE